mmetsp:Transcript_5031/g.18550  ORF Transcript_5031/g.18550 Transcript_5031/m.18550 type:complete len:563 (+) Transcript_5031:3103-4791(+)
MPDQLARGLDLHRHLGQHELHGLVFEDGLAEGDAVLAVAQRGLERGTRHAHGLRGDADAPALQARQRDLQALALVAQPVGGRHPAVLEQDLGGVAAVLAQLLFDPGDRVARRGRGHEEGADALLAGRLVRHGHHDGHVAVLATGDELLDAVEHVVVAVAHGRRAQAAGLGAHMRLGQAERAEHVAARQGFEEALLLVVVAEGHQDGANRAVVDADHRAGAAVAGGDLFEDDGQGQIVQAGAIPLGGHGHAIAAQGGQALELLGREVVGLVPGGGMGRDLGLHEGADGVLHGEVVFGEEHGELDLGFCGAPIVPRRSARPQREAQPRGLFGIGLRAPALRHDRIGLQRQPLAQFRWQRLAGPPARAVAGGQLVELLAELQGHVADRQVGLAQRMVPVLRSGPTGHIDQDVPDGIAPVQEAEQRVLHRNADAGLARQCHALQAAQRVQVVQPVGIHGLQGQLGQEAQTQAARPALQQVGLAAEELLAATRDVVEGGALGLRLGCDPELRLQQLGRQGRQPVGRQPRSRRLPRRPLGQQQLMPQHPVPGDGLAEQRLGTAGQQAQ